MSRRRVASKAPKKAEPLRKLTAKEAAPYFKIMQDKEPENQVCFIDFLIFKLKIK